MNRAGDVVRLAILKIGTLEVAIHLLRVVEIVSAKALLPTGATSATSVTGLFAIGGKLLPVFDLHHVFHGVPRAIESAALGKPAGQFVRVVADGRELVLFVDRLSEVVDTACEHLVPHPGARSTEHPALLCGAALLGANPIALLDLRALAGQSLDEAPLTA